jgi:transcriptional regulator with XRE-family HTH domain
MTRRRDTDEIEKKSASAERLVFARNFRNARKAKSMTQRDVNDQTGFAQAWISEVETGQSAINIDNMATLAHAVDVPLWQLLVP